MKNITQYPKKLIKPLIGLIVIGVVSTAFQDIMAFMVTFSKNAISNGNILLGLFFLALYYAKEPIKRLISAIYSEKHELFKEKTENSLQEVASTMMLLVKGKVRKERKVMSTSEILNPIIDYLQNTWNITIFPFQNAIRIISCIVLLFGLKSVLTDDISNKFAFFTIVSISVLLQMLFCILEVRARNTNRKPNREFKLQRENAKQEILQVEPLSQKHSVFMINNYIEANSKVFSISRKIYRKNNFLRLLEKTSMSISIILLLVLNVVEVGISNVNFETIISIMAIISIYEQILSRFSDIILIMNELQELIEERKVNKEDFSIIYNAYIIEKEKADEIGAKLESIEIPKFTIQYTSNDGEIPFTLVNNTQFNISTGNFVVLHGKTGSGKTTFMNFLTSNIFFESCKPLYYTLTKGMPKSVTHQVFHTLGARSLLEEITLGSKEIDTQKLEFILKGLRLYDELVEKAENSNIIYFLENNFKSNFSAGQIQRLAVARTLYNLTEEIQIIAFDEVTSNLDDVTAYAVLKFIKEFCSNKLIVMCSHQVQLCKEFADIELSFIKSTKNENQFCIERIS